MPTVELNGRNALGLARPLGRNEITFWASDLRGFGLRIRASGARTWLVQFRTKTGQTQRHSLGSAETVPFVKARRRAQELISHAKLGGDPAAERRLEKQAIKVSELAHAYLQHQLGRMKPRSYKELQRHLKAHAKPLHMQSAAKVTQRGVVELLQEIAGTAPVTANRVRASLSAMFAWGMKAGLIAAIQLPPPSNPLWRLLASGFCPTRNWNWCGRRPIVTAIMTASSDYCC